MIAAALPSNEVERVGELEALRILDTLPEQAYDDITFLASQICGTPIALVSLLDKDRQWFKSRYGIDAEETERDLAFCAHAILEPNHVFTVHDAFADRRFADNPLVVGDPSIRFYAGVPLTTAAGNALGTLCVIDQVPKTLSATQEEALRALARQVMAQLELRRSIGELETAAIERSRHEQQLEEYQRRLENHLTMISEQNVTDPLTGLRNRRAFLDRLDEESDRAARYGTPLSLVMIDVDHFKTLNDTRGHVEGDGALREIGETISAHSRSTDLVARYGGEEFVVILPGEDIDGAAVLAERFRRSVEHAEWGGHRLTISLGVATMACGGAEELIRHADAAMYRAKAAGRNRVST